jgi:ABC-type glycerol-3-phosphate transport system substrate-binding protein
MNDRCVLLGTKVGWVSIVLLLSLVLAACAPAAPVAPAPAGDASAEDTAAEGEATAATTGEAVELTWLSHIYEPWNNALQAQADEYMAANPGLKIVYSQVPHSDLNTKIATSIAAGEPPTIMGVYGPWMPQLLAGDALAEAPEWVLTDIEENFPPVMKEAATYDGKVYGYVQHIGIHLPIINTTMYEAAGVEPPNTYEELAAVNAKLDAPDGSVFGTALATSKDGSWNVLHWSAILKAYGGQILNDDGTAAAFNTPEGLEATNIYRSLTHAELGAHDEAFIAEQTAMMWNGPWQKSNLEQSNPDLKYKAILPIEGPAGRVAPAYVWFWVVSSAATPEQQEAAWKFLQWISAAEQYEAVYRNVGLIPITKEIPEALKDDEWVQTFNEGLQYANIYYSKNEVWEQIDVAIGEELERLVVDEITAEEFLNNAEQRVNEILQSAS